mgnify:FL=1
MDDRINDGGPAFPAWELNCQGQPEMTCFGMSLRDYFAAKAMHASLADALEGRLPDEHWRIGVAYDAYRMADAMLIARSARPAGGDE